MPSLSPHSRFRASVLSSLIFAAGLLEASPAAAQLAIAIEANPGVALPGEQLEIRITVANQGVANVAGVVANLLLPAGLDTFLTGVATPVASGCTQIVSNGACQSGETLIWNLGTLAAGQSVTASVAPIVSASATGSIVFNPILNSGPSASATVTVDAALALDVSLHEAMDPVAAGGSLEYTLHFGNRSTTTAAPNALLQLPLPAGTAFVSASNGGALGAGTVAWSLGTLQPGQSGTRRVSLTTNAGLTRGTLLLADATLSDTSAQLARARAVTEIDGLETLALALTVNPDPAAVGEQLDIELSVSNRSASPIGGVTLRLRWPQQIVGLFTVQGTSSPGGCTQIVSNAACTAGEFTQWDLATLEAGQSITVSYSASLAATPDGSLVDFEAAVHGSGGERAAASRAVAVDSASPLDVALHELRDPVFAGGDLVYTLHFGNRSTTTASPNALLQLRLPAGTTFVSASDGGGLIGDTVQWSLGTLQPGQSGTRTLALETGAGLANGSLLETRAVLSDGASPPELARVAEVSEVDGLEPLVLALTVNPDPAAVGEQLDIELSVSNPGASPVGPVTLLLRWPQQIVGLFTVQGTSSPGGCTQVASNAACSAGEFTLWTLATLEAGQSITVSYSASLAATPDGSLVDFEAIVLGTSSDQRAAVGRAVAVDSASPLDVALHELRDPVAAGGDLEYTLHFGNRSTTTASANALLQLRLPAGTTFVSASDGGGLSGDTVQWSLGTLQPGQSGTRTLALTTGAGLANGSLLETHAVLSDGASPPELARVAEVSEVDSLEPLALAVTVNPDPAAVGEQLDIELSVSNPSASPIVGVTLLLRWPQQIVGLFTVQGTSAPGGCTQVVSNAACSAGEFTQWNLATLEAGQSITVSYSASLAATPDGSLVDFEASVLGPTTTDVQARVGQAIAVDSARPLELALHEALDPVGAGDDHVYTLHYANTSMSYTAPNLLLRFPLPAGTTFVSASGGGALTGDTVEWPIGTLRQGLWASRSVTVETDGGATRGALLTAMAELTEGSVPQQHLRAHSVTEIDGLEALDVAVVLTPDLVDPTYQVDVTVTNTDIASHTGVTLVMRVPRDAATFARASVTGAPGGCTQIFSNAFCEAGEFLIWTLGTLTAGQSVTVTIPVLLVTVPSGISGELTDVSAIALGSGVDDRAVDHVIPEPGAVASLLAGLGLLALLDRRRRAPGARERS